MYPQLSSALGDAHRDDLHRAARHDRLVAAASRIARQRAQRARRAR